MCVARSKLIMTCMGNNPYPVNPGSRRAPHGRSPLTRGFRWSQAPPTRCITCSHDNTGARCFHHLGPSTTLPVQTDSTEVRRTDGTDTNDSSHSRGP